MQTRQLNLSKETLVSLETIGHLFFSLSIMLEYANPLNIAFIFDYNVQGCEHIKCIIDAALHVFELYLHLALLVDLLNSLSYLGTGRLLACPDLLHDFLREKYQLLLLETTLGAVAGAATVHSWVRCITVSAVPEVRWFWDRESISLVPVILIVRVKSVGHMQLRVRLLL